MNLGHGRSARSGMVLRFDFRRVDAIGQSGVVNVEKSEVELRSDDNGAEQQGGDGLVVAECARSCIAIGDGPVSQCWMGIGLGAVRSFFSKDGQKPARLGCGEAPVVVRVMASSGAWFGRGIAPDLWW